MKTLITMCILLICSGCVQYIEWEPCGYKKRQYNSLFKTVTADRIAIGDILIQNPASTPQDINVKGKIPHTPIEIDVGTSK